MNFLIDCPDGISFSLERELSARLLDSYFKFCVQLSLLISNYNISF